MIRFELSGNRHNFQQLENSTPEMNDQWRPQLIGEQPSETRRNETKNKTHADHRNTNLLIWTQYTASVRECTMVDGQAEQGGTDASDEVS